MFGSMNCTISRCQKRGALLYRNHSLDGGGATLFSKLDTNKLRFNVKNEMTLICAKFDADLMNISKVTSGEYSPRVLAANVRREYSRQCEIGLKQSGPGFLAYPVCQKRFGTRNFFGWLARLGNLVDSKREFPLVLMTLASFITNPCNPFHFRDSAVWAVLLCCNFGNQLQYPDRRNFLA